MLYSCSKILFFYLKCRLINVCFKENISTNILFIIYGIIKFCFYEKRKIRAQWHLIFYVYVCRPDERWGGRDSYGVRADLKKDFRRPKNCISTFSHGVRSQLSTFRIYAIIYTRRSNRFCFKCKYYIIMF